MSLSSQKDLDSFGNPVCVLERESLGVMLEVLLFA